MLATRPTVARGANAPAVQLRGARMPPQSLAHTVVRRSSRGRAVRLSVAAGKYDGLGQVVTVLGSQWGDEGKGKLVDILAQQTDIIVRAQVRHLLFRPTQTSSLPRLYATRDMRRRTMRVASSGAAPTIRLGDPQPHPAVGKRFSTRLVDEDGDSPSPNHASDTSTPGCLRSAPGLSRRHMRG
jgi:hypothetical protein